MKVPAGTTTISGHAAQSWKTVPGRIRTESAGVSGNARESSRAAATASPSPHVSRATTVPSCWAPAGWAAASSGVTATAAEMIVVVFMAGSRNPHPLR